MKVVDTNVLLAASNVSASKHLPARRWIDGALSAGEPVGFDWLVLAGFVRISTHPKITKPPLTTGRAMDIVDAWLGARSARLLEPGTRHAEYMRTLLEAAGTAGNLVNDARIAALALEHKATVVTFDSDFGKFPGVKWEQPR